MALALYRKYRPRTFAEVIGQEHVTEPLSQALRSGRLNHAYLFSGPRGCGKTSSARILARSLNCEQGPTPDPCGVCGSCRSLANDGAGSIDVIEIDAASHGGVDDARELREKAFFAPANSRYKIYVIDEAHMVSSAGFNALLKLVEEPPEFVKFIFATTEPDKVLGTIRSRTHHYPFRLIPPATLRPYLQQLTEAEGVQVDPAVFPLVVRAGGGSARDTLSVLDQLIAGAGPDGVSYSRAVALLGVTDVALIDEMCDALATGDGAAAYATIDRVAEAGHDPRRFASDLLERLRDLIVLQQVPDAVAKGLIDGPADQLEAMARQAGRLGQATLSRCADIVHNGLVEMRGTTAPRLLLELITARMLLPAAEDSTGALLQRLERLERSGGRVVSSADPGADVSPVVSAPQASGAVTSGLQGSGAVASGPQASGAVASGPQASGAVTSGLQASGAVTSAPQPPGGGAPTAAAPAGGLPAGAGGSAKAAAMAAAAAARRPSGSPGRAAAPVSPAAPASPSPAPEAPAGAAPAAAASVASSSGAPGPVSAAPAAATSAGAASAVPASPASAADEAPDWNAVADGGYAEEPPPWDDEPPEPPAADPEAQATDRWEKIQSAWLDLGRQNKTVGVIQTSGIDLRTVEGDTVVFGAPNPKYAERFLTYRDVITDAFTQALGGQWQIRCDVGEPTPQRTAPPAGRDQSPTRRPSSDGPARSSAPVPPVPATPERNTGRTEPRPSRPQRAAAADADDDWPEPARPADRQARPEETGEGWPEPARPAGRSTAADDRDTGWPEPVRPGGSGGRGERPGAVASQADPGHSAAGTDSGWPEPARPGGSAGGSAGGGRPGAVASQADSGRSEAHTDSGWPEPSRPGGRAEANAGSGSGVPSRPSGPEADPGRSNAARSEERGDSTSSDSGWPEPARPGDRVSATGDMASASSAPWPSAGTDSTGPGSTGPAGSASGGPTGSGGGGPAGRAGLAGGPAGPAVPVSGGPAGLGGSAGGGPAGAAGLAGGGPAGLAGASGGRSPGSVGGAAVSVSPGSGGAPGGAAPRSPQEAARAAARGGNAVPSSGLAAARAAAANAANRGPATAKSAPAPAASAGAGADSGSTWSDGTPIGEAPYDPEYDGPPSGRGAAYEGFDPGDEPTDDVIDEKTARQSSEEQAMQLLREAFGAEKIGEI